MAENNQGNQNSNNTESVVSTGSWFVFMFLMTIPILNVILVLVEAFGSGSNKNKQNFCRAAILWVVLGIVGIIVCAVLFGAAISAMINSVDWNNVHLGSSSLSDAMEQIEKAKEAAEAAKGTPAP
ncbi:MAG: hypothetical protein IKY83_07855 [Proteobacteria bacterium]|nr:hypothetical protein [Pseudomonadota bacterium]